MASPDEMALSMRENIEAKTGEKESHWFDVLAHSSLEKHGQMVKLLKEQHNVTHGFANLIVSDFLNKDHQLNEADLINAQYEGAKAPLRVIYEAIIERLQSLAELEISPKKSYVSLRHHKQFAIIQPSTKTRVDVGLNLKDSPATDRLELSGSFNAMVSHRVRLTDVNQVDDELIEWLALAYHNN